MRTPFLYSSLAEANAKVMKLYPVFNIKYEINPIEKHERSLSKGMILFYRQFLFAQIEDANYY